MHKNKNTGIYLQTLKCTKATNNQQNRMLNVKKATKSLLSGSSEFRSVFIYGNCIPPYVFFKTLLNEKFKLSKQLYCTGFVLYLVLKMITKFKPRHL